MKLLLTDTIRCTKCGEEVKDGIVNSAEHFYSCKHNAPNENIEHHKDMVELEKMNDKKNKAFEPTFKKMTKSEQEELYLLSMCGIYDGGTVLMGKVAYDRYDDFRDEMTNKYT